MIATAGVFVLTDQASLVPMQAASFASEDDFQDLLAKFPALLAGDQIDAANPRRFFLIDREYPIAGAAGEGGRWSLDHLFLDQDGVPTLVEVKRGSDTRIRREVVGQMMDYAANAVAYWPAEVLQDRFIQRCKVLGRQPQEALAEEFGVDVEWDAYWASVKANLQCGRVRLLFVADRIPSELRRVVEFLNVQMRPAEVLAIELRQYQGGDLRTLAPIVFGQTQEALEHKTGVERKPRKLWDEAQLLAKLAEREGAGVRDIAMAILEGIRTRGDKCAFNDAPSYGAATVELAFGAETVPLFKVWTDGNLQVMFSALARTSAYADAEPRKELLKSLAEVSGAPIKADAIQGSPCVRLAALNGDRVEKLLEIFDEVANRLKEAQGV